MPDTQFLQKRQMAMGFPSDVRRDSAACFPTDPSGHGLPITTTWMVSENQLMSMLIDQRSRFGFDECERCREHGA